MPAARAAAAAVAVAGVPETLQPRGYLALRNCLDCYAPSEVVPVAAAVAVAGIEAVPQLRWLIKGHLPLCPLRRPWLLRRPRLW